MSSKYHLIAHWSPWWLIPELHCRKGTKYRLNVPLQLLLHQQPESDSYKELLGIWENFPGETKNWFSCNFTIKTLKIEDIFLSGQNSALYVCKLTHQNPLNYEKLAILCHHSFFLNQLLFTSVNKTWFFDFQKSSYVTLFTYRLHWS